MVDCGGPHVKDLRTWDRDTEGGKGQEIFQVDTWKCQKRVKGERCSGVITKTKKVVTQAEKLAESSLVVLHLAL